MTHSSNSPFQGVLQLAIALSEETEDHILAATAWALGQIGRHTPEHSKAVALANVLPRLLHLYLKTGSSEDLQAKVSSNYLVINILYVGYLIKLAFIKIYFLGQKIVEEHPSKMHSSTSVRTSVT